MNGGCADGIPEVGKEIRPRDRSCADTSETTAKTNSNRRARKARREMFFSANSANSAVAFPLPRVTEHRLRHPHEPALRQDSTERGVTLSHRHVAATRLQTIEEVDHLDLDLSRLGSAQPNVLR